MISKKQKETLQSQKRSAACALTLTKELERIWAKWCEISHEGRAETNESPVVFTRTLTMTHRCLNRTPATSTLLALINGVR